MFDNKTRYAVRKRAYEIYLEFPQGKPGQAEVLRCVLARLGIEEGDIAELEINARIRLSFFVASRRRADFLKRAITGLRLKGVSVSFVSLETKDWQNRWKEDFKPFDLTRKVRVVPVWMRGIRKRRKANQVFIDTDTVFGTGMHPTTRFMAAFIEGKRNKCGDFFDIGTGTGILTLVAWKNGMRRLGCIDISKDAVRVAKRNFIRNGCFPEFIKAVDFNYFCPQRKFDFVAANLLTEDLIKMRNKLVACVRRGRYLAVSGISTGNYERFRQKFDTKSLQCLRVTKKDGWAAVLYKVVRG